MVGLRGLIQIKFHNDIVAAISNGWVVSKHGAKPRISKGIDRRVRGLAKHGEENVIVRSQGGEMVEYSMGAADLKQGGLASIDIDTAKLSLIHI